MTYPRTSLAGAKRFGSTLGRASVALIIVLTAIGATSQARAATWGNNPGVADEVFNDSGNTPAYNIMDGGYAVMSIISNPQYGQVRPLQIVMRTSGEWMAIGYFDGCLLGSGTVAGGHNCSSSFAGVATYFEAYSCVFGCGYINNVVGGVFTNSSVPYQLQRKFAAAGYYQYEFFWGSSNIENVIFTNWMTGAVSSGFVGIGSERSGTNYSVPANQTNNGLLAHSYGETSTNPPGTTGYHSWNSYTYLHDKGCYATVYGLTQQIAGGSC